MKLPKWLQFWKKKVSLPVENDLRKVLSPCLVGREDEAHLAVDDLRFAVEQSESRNIAVTGSYGSGKSSVINTYISESRKEDKVLRISLSTFALKDNTTEEEKNNKAGYNEENPKNASDRRIRERKKEADIEYKIVQHLLYKSDQRKTPFSQYKRIRHITRGRLLWYVVAIIVAFMCFIIAFEPTALRVDSFYDFYHGIFGKNAAVVKRWADVVAVFCLLLFAAKLVYFAIVKISGLRNFSVKADKVEVNLSKNSSVFNKLLDEIVYTLKANEYELVVFEDLDRLDYADRLFLKIRELNMLINESEFFRKKGRIIRFIYAVRDDVFTRELRTKCFDYIVAVMPVVDRYNVNDYLIKEYKQGLFSKIDDASLDLITSRVTGLRELKNIVNEYTLYERSLRPYMGDSLSESTLLAVIVYKNLFPDDFGKIYMREGLLYTVMNSKLAFTEGKTREAKSQLEGVENDIKAAWEKIVKCRMEYLNHLVSNDNLVYFIRQNVRHSVKQVAESDRLFEYFRKDDFDKYYYEDATSDESGTLEYCFKFKDIEDKVSEDMGYEEAVDSDRQAYLASNNMKKLLERTIRTQQTTRFSELFKTLGDKEAKAVMDDIYKEQNSEKAELDKQSREQIDVIWEFVYNGFFEEDYYLYISKFYPGTLSGRDYLFRNSVMQGLTLPYDYKLDNAKAVCEKLKQRINDFKVKSILNYDVLECLLAENDFLYLPTFIDTVRNNLDFVTAYQNEREQPVETFIHKVFEGWEGGLGHIAEVDSDVLRNDLLKFYLQVSPTDHRLNDSERKFMERQYSLIHQHIKMIDVKQMKRFVSLNGLKFDNLLAPNDDTAALFDYLLNYNYYQTNEKNVRVIVGVDFDSKPMTAILALGNKAAMKRLQDEIDTVSGYFPETSTDEEPMAMTLLLNQKSLSEEWKRQYMGQQKMVFEDVSELLGEGMKVVQVLDKMTATWANIYEIYSYFETIEPEMMRFIVAHADELSKEEFEAEDDEEKRQTFHTVLFTNEDLPIEVFSKLTGCFEEGFTLDGLKNLSEDKVAYVVDSCLLNYDSKTFQYLKDNCVYDIWKTYLIQNYDEFMEDDGVNLSVLKTDQLGIDILNSTLTLEQKKHYLDDYGAMLGQDEAPNSELSRLICEYTLRCGINKETEVEMLIKAMQRHKGEGSWQTKIRLLNMYNAVREYKQKTESRLIATLGDEYLKLNSLHGKAQFEVNDENRTLLEYLQRKGHYVSKFPEVDGQFRVSFKSKMG